MLDFLISPEANFELEESRKILETEKVVYVLSSESSYDLTALKKCAKRNSYTFPSRIKKLFFNSKGLEDYSLGSVQEEDIQENLMNWLLVQTKQQSY